MINNVGQTPNIKQSNVDQSAPKAVSSADYEAVDTDSGDEVVYSKSEIKKHCADLMSDNLRYLVEELIQHQGKLRNRAAISLQDINEAKQAISEDGPFGVKAVSDRIVSFAIAVSGNDKSKLETLKAAIEKGFDQAREAFGGTLPDICNQTHDEVMRKLDEWAQSGDSVSE